MGLLRAMRLTTTGAAGISIVALVTVCALGAPWIAPYRPNHTDLLNPLAPPAWTHAGTPAHLLGTDKLGRDILSRIIYASRVSLVAASSAVLGAGVLGTVLGIAAGYLGRFVENVIMRLVDIMLAIPFILFALVIISVLGATLPNLIMTFISVRWVQYTRIAYSQTLEVKELDYVTAAIASGAPAGRIMIRHVLPNILSPLFVVATLELGFVILLESGLSFLGLGVPPTIPSWGQMLQEGRSLINVAWWLTTFPGVAIAVTVMGFNFVGDWFRDVFDPRR